MLQAIDIEKKNTGYACAAAPAKAAVMVNMRGRNIFNGL